MNILITQENYYPLHHGGTMQFIIGMAEYLKLKGYKVFVYTCSYRESNLFGEVERPEATVNYSDFMVGSMSDPFAVTKYISEFVKYIREKKIDLVFANNHNSLAWIKASKKAGVPVVYGCHGVGLMDPLKRRFLMPNDELCYGFPSIKEASRWFWMENRSLMKKLLGFLLFFSPFIRSTKVRNYWQYKEAVAILNSADARYGNSAITAKLFSNKKNTFGFPLAINASNQMMSNHYYPLVDDDFLKKFNLKNKSYILCPGRLNYIKGQEYMIKALLSIKNKNLKLVFTGNAALFGDKFEQMSAYENRIRDLTKEYNLSDRIVFTGLLDFGDMRKIYSSALVTVIPSVWLETFGYVTIESMACGTSAIVTSNCGSAECVSREDGFIIDRKNEKQISDIINDNESRFVDLGERARKKVLDNYDWSVSGDKYLDIFTKVYSERKSVKVYSN